MSCAEYLKDPRVYLRLFEMMFALIAFATVASLQDTAYAYLASSDENVPVKFTTYPSYMGFMIFTGVSGWLLAIIFMILLGIRKLRNNPKLDIADLVINFVWFVFFLAAAAAMADKVDASCGRVYYITNNAWCNTYRASVAFGFLSAILWLASLVISVVSVLRGRTSSPSKYGSSGGPGVQMTSNTSAPV